ncbi:endopeptidase La [Salibacter halophilus]|uniref:Lon protease n=2 Tax=Salibacter halophilus TaxID=1803916 RepID=A0A6N6MAN0_9FLAO|nr:endopeptidase La [Salibacter halophilus]
MIGDDTEFIPLLSKDDEDQMKNEAVPESLSLLPLRNNVLYPGVVIPITVGRDKSIKLVNEAYSEKKAIGVVAQKDGSIENPEAQHLNKVGTVARIIKKLQMPDGSITVIIQGKRRMEIEEIVTDDPFFKAKIKPIDEVMPDEDDERFDALVSSIRELALKIIQESPNIPSDAQVAIKNIESPSFLINFISSNLSRPVDVKQELLEELDVNKRAQRVLELLTEEFQMLELKNDIQSKVKTDIDKQQREYFLHQQMKQIQEELGGNPLDQEVSEFKEKAKKKKWGKEVKEVFEKELSKLERMNPTGVEYSVQSNYLDTMLDLPWNEYTTDNFDLKRAEKILDRDHYGLEKVKERILEHLAVIKLKDDMKAPIICLAGPPGVGKTSLGRSIAEALGRKYQRMSLGGLRDEAEIRGHRKTYIGAMPGRIIQSVKKAGSSNPVFILDEIDKVGHGPHGDPSSALLEVLDPEQNDTFTDNFLEVDYDLSKVMFVATANNLGQIQPALRDRLEIIEVNGYTVEEKIEIAKRHLIPKQLKEHGLKKNQFKIAKKVLEKLIEEHTRESGVRSLEKKIAKLVRQIAKAIAMEEEYDVNIKAEDLTKYLGPGHEKERYEGNEHAGVVTGLAWTAVGGDILFIETSVTKGKGKLTLTGSLGDVMKESAMVALEYMRSHADHLNLDPEVFDKYNVHIHVPEGAIPKDGPSAGITMLTSLASAFTQRKIKSRLAMTGEITLRGRVLPVGGIKEKILAAKRANINEIILSEQNKKDVEEIDERYLKGLKFHYVKEMIEVTDIALLKEKVKDPQKIE